MRPEISQSFHVASTLLTTLLVFFITLGTHTTAFARNAPNHPLLGKILDAKGKAITQTKAFDKLRQHAYVFVGEKHDNPVHHEIELAIIKARFDKQSNEKQGRIVFEMLDDSQDVDLAKLNINQSLEQMREALRWPQKGWDWSIYSPLFHESLKHQALASGNISRALISSIYKDGQKILSSSARFSTAASASEDVKSYLLDQIFNSHCGMQSRETLQPMLHIQLAKDASMANAMAATPAAMLIAGGEHVRPHTGAPSHLKTLKPNASRLIIQILEVKDGANELKDYLKAAGAADLYWFTSATAEKDYCADVKGKAAQ